jgi:hypothetical protein
MMRILIGISLLLLFTACEENKSTENLYYLEFKLVGLDGVAHEINISQETPATLNGHGIKDSNQVALGFALNGTFASLFEKEVTQNLSFYFATEIPETEFSIDSQGIYTLKSPADFRNYLPSGNLFENDNLSARSYFHEDTNTFCTALLDTAFAQKLSITNKNYYVDNDGNDALDIEGTFGTGYSSFCGEDKSTNGTFKIKLLLNASPSD